MSRGLQLRHANRIYAHQAMRAEMTAPHYILPRRYRSGGIYPLELHNFWLWQFSQIPPFTTIEELRKLSKEELLRIRGLGNKGVQEIIEVLNNDN